MYVGSATGPQFDQELENVLVGPVPVGTSKFVLTAPSPDAKLIPEDDVLGATVVLVCCSYKGAEFIRVGFWVNNTYGEALAEGAPRFRAEARKLSAHGGGRRATPRVRRVMCLSPSLPLSLRTRAPENALSPLCRRRGTEADAARKNNSQHFG